MSKELLQSALDLAAHGWRVFPLKPGTKVPAIKDWPNLATTDRDQIAKVWGGSIDWNIGVACGQGLLGMDVDVKRGKDGFESARRLGLELEAGFTVETPSGGRHAYLRGSDVGNSAGRLGPGLDVRSSGGYLVGPGSILPEGSYRVLTHEAPLPAPPAVFSALATRSEPRGAAPVVADEPGAVGRCVEYLRHAPLAIEGQGGDHTTFVVTAQLKDYGVSQDMAVDLLAEHWLPRCGAPWPIADQIEWLKTKVANAYAYGSRPIGDLHPASDFAGVKIEPPPPTRATTGWFRHGQDLSLDTSWLYYELLPATGVAVLSAPTGAGKTFLSVELARSLATGKAFFDTPPDDRGGTLFVFAGTEGSGFARRLKALGEDKALPISATTCANLSERGALDGLLTSLKEEAAHIQEAFGVPVRLVVLETMAASGLLTDENDNAEASRAMSNLAQISRAMGALVMTSHHPDKSGKGPRGASAIPSSADYLLTINREGKSAVREVVLEKARDAEERRLGSFTLIDVHLGDDARGRPIKSMTVSMGGVVTNAVRAAAHMEPFMEALEWATIEDGEDVNGRKGVEISFVRDTFKDRKPGSKDKSNVAKAFKAAMAYGESMGAFEVVPFNGGTYLIPREIVT